jgi:hypothetical protein
MTTCVTASAAMTAATRMVTAHAKKKTKIVIMFL